MRRFIFIAFILLSKFAVGQQSVNFEDLQAIKNGVMTFYNVEGYSITTQSYSSPFNEKKLRPVYREYKIKRKKQIPEVNKSLGFKNYYFVSIDKVDEKITSYYIRYFIENKGRISVVTFSSFDMPTDEFIQSFIKMFVNDEFPKGIYADKTISSIKFVNRDIKLGPGCQWMGVRNVQCPYNGQMDWTLHSTLQKAKEFNEVREYTSTNFRKLKVVSRDVVKGTFEGKESDIIKVVYDIKGMNSFLLKLESGAKNLIVYYIAQEIEGKNVSCILSHWDNDKIQANGLPALLGEVMSLR